MTADGRVVLIDFGGTRHITEADNKVKDIEYFIQRWLDKAKFLPPASTEYHEIKAACDEAKVAVLSKNTHTNHNHSHSQQLPFAKIYGACWRLHARLQAAIAPPPPTKAQMARERMNDVVDQAQLITDLW